MNPYSELIERLIALKDMHRGELELSEMDAINDACNALEKAGASNIPAAAPAY